MSFTEKQIKFANDIRNFYTEAQAESGLSRKEIKKFCDDTGNKFPTWLTFTHKEIFCVGRATYRVPDLSDSNITSTVKAKAPVKVESTSVEPTGKVGDGVVITAEEIVDAAVVDDRPIIKEEKSVEMTKL